MSTSSTPRDSRDVPQMHKRSLHHDYHGRGIYLITLCTEGRQPLLGKLTGSSLEEAAIEPTALGREVLRCWDQIPAIQRQLAEKKIAKTGKPCVRDILLLDRRLMPDHFHGILYVRQEMDIALGDVIRGFMIGCTKAFNGASSPAGPQASPQICGAPNRQALPAIPAQRGEGGRLQGESGAQQGEGERMQGEGGGLQGEGGAQRAAGGAQQVGCSAYSRGEKERAPLRPLWEKGYHDRLLMHEGQLQNMIDYVRDNPRRLMLRRQHRDLFIVQRNVVFGQWSFSAIGQVRLLDAPLVAVHVRHYFTDVQRRNYMNGCILAARQGAVLISPFISEHEKLVREEAFREGLFCIQLCVEPFSDYHKPPGELIEHCSDGHLLLLTLATGVAQERRITRDECSSLNALAESMARQSTENIKLSSLC